MTSDTIHDVVIPEPSILYLKRNKDIHTLHLLDGTILIIDADIYTRLRNSLSSPTYPITVPAATDPDAP